MKYTTKSAFFIFLIVRSYISFSAGLHISVEYGVTAVILNVKTDPFSIRPDPKYLEISAPKGMSSIKEIHMCTAPGQVYNYDAGTEGFESIMWEYNGNIYKANLNIDGIQGWRDLHIDTSTSVHVGPWLFEPEITINGSKVKQGPLLKDCVKNYPSVLKLPRTSQ